MILIEATEEEDLGCVTACGLVKSLAIAVVGC
jgi:hypothetical protein